MNAKRRKRKSSVSSSTKKTKKKEERKVIRTKPEKTRPEKIKTSRRTLERPNKKRGDSGLRLLIPSLMKWATADSWFDIVRTSSLRPRTKPSRRRSYKILTCKRLLGKVLGQRKRELALLRVRRGTSMKKRYRSAAKNSTKPNPTKSNCLLWSTLLKLWGCLTTTRLFHRPKTSRSTRSSRLFKQRSTTTRTLTLTQFLALESRNRRSIERRRTTDLRRSPSMRATSQVFDSIQIISALLEEYSRIRANN